MKNEKMVMISMTLNEFNNEIELVMRKVINELNNGNNNQPTEFSELMIDRKRLCSMLSTTPPTVIGWEKKGILKSYQIGGRVYYKKNEVEEMLSEQSNRWKK